MHRHRTITTIILLFVVALAIPPAAADLPIRNIPLFNPARLVLTREYARVHYGMDTDRLTEPQMIVVHYTAFRTFKESLDFFRPEHLVSRDDIRKGGRVNVSAHYLVDSAGDIYRMADDDVLCRHIIGFNHVALGIENVARDAAGLTDAQLEANAALIAELSAKHPTIRYLIGHHEYEDRSLPHYELRRELQVGYRPTSKNDPGPKFMSRLREILKSRYDLQFIP